MQCELNFDFFFFYIRYCANIVILLVSILPISVRIFFFFFLFRIFSEISFWQIKSYNISLFDYCRDVLPGPDVIKPFSCSNQLSMTFVV